MAHSAGSKALVEDKVIRGWFGMQYDCLYAAFNKVCLSLSMSAAAQLTMSRQWMP